MTAERPIGERVAVAETLLLKMSETLGQVAAQVTQLGHKIDSTMMSITNDRTQDSRRIDNIHGDLAGLKSRIDALERQVHSVTVAVEANTEIRKRVAYVVAAATAVAGAMTGVIVWWGKIKVVLMEAIRGL